MKKILMFTCLIVIIMVHGIWAAGNYPFPQRGSVTYPYGIRASNTVYSETNIRNNYSTWKSRYVQSGGCTGCLKVVSPEPVPGYGSNYTVSEGIAYGMLISVYMDDKTTFDGLWAFKANKGAAKLAAGKANSLMPWVIDTSNNIVDYNSATDADIDIAFALLMADKQWGSGGTYNYCFN